MSGGQQAGKAGIGHVNRSSMSVGSGLPPPRSWGPRHHGSVASTILAKWLVDEKMTHLKDTDGDLRGGDRPPQDPGVCVAPVLQEASHHHPQPGELRGDWPQSVRRFSRVPVPRPGWVPTPTGLFSGINETTQGDPQVCAMCSENARQVPSAGRPGAPGPAGRARGWLPRVHSVPGQQPCGRVRTAAGGVGWHG